MLLFQYLIALVAMATKGASSFSISLSGSKPTSLRSTSFHRRSPSVSRSAFALSGTPRLAPFSTSRASLLVMKDVSASTSLKIGDVVIVVDDVLKAGINLRGKQGVVVETWEKCAIDPSCCCAEVDRSMAIRVEFPTNTTNITATVNEGATSSSFEFHFAEEELWKSPDSKGTGSSE